MALLVSFKLTLGVAQLGIDLLQTGVDERLCANGNLVLVLIGLAVVANHQLLQVVGSTLRVLVAQDELGDGRGLRRLTHRERTGILIRHGFRRTDGHEVNGTFVNRLRGVGDNRDGASLGADGGRQLGDGLVERSFVGDDTRDVVAVALRDNLQLDGSTQLLEMSRVEVDGERVVLIEKVLLDFSLAHVGDIKLEVADSLLGDGTRLQDFHFVVDTCRVGNGSQRGSIDDAVSSSSVAFLFLDEHLRIRLINRCLVAQVDGCKSQADDQREHEPLPVQDDGGVDGLKVKN